MTEPLGIDAQAIGRRAHELWLKRGCPTGTPELDWVEAERELRAEALAAEASRSRAAVATSRVVTAGDSAPRLPRPRAPRTIVTRAGNAPAARLLLALVPEAYPDRAVAGIDRASRRR